MHHQWWVGLDIGTQVIGSELEPHQFEAQPIGEARGLLAAISVEVGEK